MADGFGIRIFGKLGVTARAFGWLAAIHFTNFTWRENLCVYRDRNGRVIAWSWGWLWFELAHAKSALN